MKIFITILFLVCFVQLIAQSNISNDTSKASGRLSDSIYVHPEVEAKFKKGNWGEFLQRNMNYPREAQKKEIQGQVIVQFIIESDGSLSNIQALWGPNELREGAVNLIRKSPRWMPAMNGGKPVRSIIKQPISYKLQK